MAHTPGPWHAWDRGIGWEVHGPNNQEINLEFRSTFTEADARLIAAAPDLLAVARMADAFSQTQPRDYRAKLTVAARAAIAKAEGRTS